MVRRNGTIKATYSTDQKSRMPAAKEFSAEIFDQICEMHSFMLTDFERWLDAYPEWEQRGRTDEGASAAVRLYCLHVLSGQFSTSTRGVGFVFWWIVNDTSGSPPAFIDLIAKETKAWAANELQKEKAK
jgi:hypothetical protein